MATVKFDHRVKYAKVWHPAHTVFDVEDKDVPELKKLGCQVLSYNEAPAQPSTPPAGGPAENADDADENTAYSGEDEGSDENTVADIKEELLTYTTAQLQAFAKENDIDLQGKTRKADIYNLIVASL
jgi:hypothetical protein